MWKCANIQQPTANIQFAPLSLDNGYWILDTGYWILDIGYWILDTGYWILDIGYLHIFTFPSLPTQSGGGQFHSCKGFHGLLLSCRMWKCANIQQPTTNIQFAPLSLDNGYWILDTGYWILDTGYWILDIYTFSHFPLPCAERRRTISFAQMVFMSCSFLVECGNVQISNSQQPISNLPRHHWILDTGYWILDIYTFSHFPLPYAERRRTS